MDTISRLDRFAANNRILILLSLDILSWTLSIFLFFRLRYLDYNFGAKESFPNLLSAIGLTIGIQLCIGTLTWIYRGRYRLGSKEEALMLGTTFVVTGVTLTIISLLKRPHLIPISVGVASTASALVFGISGRILIRIVHESTRRPVSAQRALIFGLGSAGIQLIDNMLSDPTSPYIPVGFLDDDGRKRGLRIRGIGYYGSRNDILHAVKLTDATCLIIAVTNGSSLLYQELNTAAIDAGIETKILPPISTIFDGKVGFRDLNDINILDLLGRHPISTDIQSIAGYLQNKRVLITGAGGSIGSELTRQILRYNPSQVLKLDRDESSLHGLELLIFGKATLDSHDLILGDIRDNQFLDSIFKKHRPEVVFHAAALKHLPLLENNPTEAWKTNVIGTLNLLQVAAENEVEIFINVSTDKAAQPISALGYSKRIAEMLTSTFDSTFSGNYVSVRFGNVLGSRGSVLTTFANQIASGGPLTITHPDVTRYFMTIPEAVQLVIQAAAIGDSGKALVLDMGEPVSILLVAEQLIEQAGKQVEIVYTGLREGEKLHEDLFSHSEIGQPTKHPLISEVNVPTIDIQLIRDIEPNSVTLETLKIIGNLDS